MRKIFTLTIYMYMLRDIYPSLVGMLLNCSVVVGEYSILLHSEGPRR